MIDEFQDYTLADLYQLRDDIDAEITRRNMSNIFGTDEFDPELFEEEALEFVNTQAYYDGLESPFGMKAVYETSFPGIIAIPGVVIDQDKSGSRHECCLATIRNSTRDRDECWAWAPCFNKEEHYITNYSVKVDKVRHSVSFWKVFPGMVVVFHTRELKAGAHAKRAMDAIRVTYEDGELALSTIAEGHWQNLPVPPKTDDWS